jgi:hypothetical protein
MANEGVRLAPGRWEEVGKWAETNLPGDGQFSNLNDDFIFYLGILIVLTFKTYRNTEFNSMEEERGHFLYQISLTRTDRMGRFDIYINVYLRGPEAPGTLGEFCKLYEQEKITKGVSVADVEDAIERLRTAKEFPQVEKAYNTFIMKLIEPPDRSDIHDILGYDESLLKEPGSLPNAEDEFRIPERHEIHDILGYDS